MALSARSSAAARDASGSRGAAALAARAVAIIHANSPAMNTWRSLIPTLPLIATDTTTIVIAKSTYVVEAITSGWRPRMEAQLAIRFGRELGFARGDQFQARADLLSLELALGEFQVDLEVPRL
jgi:hypothetical protein